MKTFNEISPKIEFENWGEAFDIAHAILSLCHGSAIHLSNTSQENLNDWEYNELTGVDNMDIARGIELVKHTIPFMDIEKILKENI